MDQEPNRVMIPLKTGEVHFDDIITLENFQFIKISEESITKTAEEWRKAKKGIRFPLTVNQHTDVMKFKKLVIENMTPQAFVDEDFLQVLPHAKKRINYRLEGKDSDLGEIDDVKIAQAFFDAVEVIEAEWKGSRRLRYRFRSKYDNKDIELVLIFNNSVVVITIMVPKGGPSKKDPGFRLGDIVKTSSWNKK